MNLISCETPDLHHSSACTVHANKNFRFRSVEWPLYGPDSPVGFLLVFRLEHLVCYSLVWPILGARSSLF